MMDKSLMRTGRGLAGRRIRVAALLIAPVLFGGCSVPDWADPFSSDYGPVPQPVTRAGAAPAIPPAPDSGLAADTKNVRHSASREVAAVTRDSTADAEEVRRAAAARPEIQVTRVETPVVETPRVTAPQVQAPRVEAAQPAAPRVATPVAPASTRVAIAPAPDPAPAPGSSSRVTSAPASDAVANSPTPMIAAMTRGQQPPSFNSDGSVVARRTNVQPSSNVSLRNPVTPATPEQTAAAPTVVATRTDNRTGTTSTTALVAPAASAQAASAQAASAPTAPAYVTAPAPAPETTLDRTYRDQLRAAGIEPVARDGAAQPGSGAVAPGQFPNSVSPAIQQTYLQSLNAPQTYQQAIGAAPRSAGSTVVVNGGGGYGSGGYGGAANGPVVISGDGVYQPAARQAAATGTGFNAGNGAAAVIPFGHNSARLSARDDAVIRQIVAAAMNSNARVRVVGHASSRTGEQPVSKHLLANLRISADRANVVADRIAALGVPYERIIVEAVGDNQPMYNEAMPSGETGNRRAEIFLE